MFALLTLDKEDLAHLRGSRDDTCEGCTRNEKMLLLRRRTPRFLAIFAQKTVVSDEDPLCF